MSIIKGVTGFVGRRFNVKRWVGFDYLRSNAKYVYTTAQDVFKKPTLGKADTFTDAVSQYHLDDAALKERYQSCKTFFNFFAILASAIFLYSLYLICLSSFMGALLGLSVTGLLGVQAFKYHFWMFQIQHKKLGCTFAEWRAGKTIEEQQGKSHE